jgi:WD40 repeat protein
MAQEGEIWQAKWSADGSCILTACYDGVARVRDAVTGDELLTLSGHEGPIRHVEWNRDESRILTIGDDSTSRVWDAETGDELFALSGDLAEWSSDGSRVLTAGKDGTVRQYFARMENLLEAACQRAVRNMNRDEWHRYMSGESYRETCPGRLVPGQD